MLLVMIEIEKYMGWFTSYATVNIHKRKYGIKVILDIKIMSQNYHLES